jgi:hypothetical protein
MTFDADKYIAIVPVHCGNKHGTAFFVSPNQLLTAWHVVSEGVRNKVPVYCFYKDYSFVCDVVDLYKEGDVALLTARNYAHPDWFRLLALPFYVEKPMVMVGYPMEIGMGYDMFDIPVHKPRKVSKREYDVVASPLEPIPFHSYKGYSGSPIVTDDGFVVGVVTDQLCSVIGYTSVARAKDKITSEGFSVISEWEGYDTSTYGFARSKGMVDGKIDKAGDRYSPNEHVDSDTLKKDFEIFCSIAEQTRLNYDLAYKQAECWYLTLRAKYAFINESYKNGDYSSLQIRLVELRQKLNSNDKSLKAYKAITSKEKDALDGWLALMNEIFNTWQDTNRHCAFLRGAAGTGKTHFLCHLAKEHGFEYQAYLLFGSDFKVGDELEGQIERLLDFPDGLKGLDDYMNDKGRFGIVIIDALNEGAGFAYWVQEVNRIPDLADKYSHLRFILSSRDPIPNGFLTDDGKWMVRFSTNSIDPIKLRNKYFEKYKIDQSCVGQNIQEFSNPLFLRIFCVSYKMIPANRRSNITKPVLFDLYLRIRNKDVVDFVNEDPYINVLGRYFKKLANYSLFYGYCNDVSRDKARQYSRQISPGRLWKQSLLHVCLQENLLLESFDDSGSPCVEFEYENLGDYMKALVLMHSKLDGNGVCDWLYLQKSIIKKKKFSPIKFTHFVGALLSLGSEKTDLFVKKALDGTDWNVELMDTLQYRGPYNKDIVSKFLEDGNIKIINYLIRDVEEYGSEQIEGLHQTLMKMKLPERDLKWSVKLNELYDWSGREAFSGKRSTGIDLKFENKKLAILLAWMLTSSYPELRAIIVRNLVDLFTETPVVAKYTCEQFCQCDDPYVIAGLYCAAYGMCLRLRDAELIGDLGKTLYELNYSDPTNIPDDLMVRYWSMKIIERAYSLNPKFEYWGKIKPPFSTGNNPFNLLLKSGDVENADYFGVSNGSHLLYNSIFGFSDFNRYVIGTNTPPFNRVLIEGDTHKAVQQEDIKKMIAVRVNELGWNEELGETDDGKYSTSRFENEKERIGKKYQWLAYYDIMGRLTDCCLLRKGWYGSKQAEIHGVNYPWYSDVRNYFDPALQIVKKEGVGVFFEEENESRLLEAEPIEWYNDDTKLPEVQLLKTDNSDEVWVWFCGFDAEYHEDDEFRRSKSIYVNSAFVHKEDVNNFEKWAKDQNFYGRWMPERRDNIDFRWNEYPWADSYKQSLELDQWERPYENNCPADVMVSYMAQLQENVRGFVKDKDFSSSVFVPCEDMMNRLGLYTAERGVVRAAGTDNAIACIDYRLTGDERSGMLMKKTFLDKYLEETEFTLFWFVLGEKAQGVAMTSAMKDISGCWKYDNVNGLTEVQPLHITESHPE